MARPGQGEHAAKAFEQAAELLQKGRERPALSAAEEAKALAPRSGLVREVLGIALYRNERYRDALRELQAYRRMTGRLDQNHLIADSYRALGSPEKAVVPAQEAIRSTAPDEVRSEAAVVGASALADLGRYTEALALLRSYRGRDRGVRTHDVRRWYVTGDVLERAGRPAEAADEFRRVVRYEAGAFDAAERLARLT
jgi:tetratricopeptide (TPR) repeat protein